MTSTGNKKADAGSSLSSVPDHELDAYIADLILQKSRAKEAKSQTEGIRAYLEDEASDGSRMRVPNTNKRFLASVIRNVEGHNQALLRQQAREAECAARRANQNAGHKEREAGEENHKASSLKLRGWPDEHVVSPYKGRSRSPSVVQSQEDLPQRNEMSSLSSKMDKYFEETERNGKASESSKQYSAIERRSSKRRRDEGRYSHRSDRRESDRERKQRSSKSTSNRHYDRGHRSEGSEQRSKRDDDHDRSRKNRNDGEDSRHKRRQEKRKDDSSSRRKEHESSNRSSRSHREGSKHRDRCDRDKTEGSSRDPPPKKVREWDLGKDSLAL